MYSSLIETIIMIWTKKVANGWACRETQITDVELIVDTRLNQLFVISKEEHRAGLPEIKFGPKCLKILANTSKQVTDKLYNLKSVVTGKSYKIRQSLFCRTDYNIYCAICTLCNKQCVGSSV